MNADKIIADLFRHMEWADDKVWESLTAFPAALEDSRIRQLFYHLHLVQYAFYNIWCQRARVYPKPEEFKDMEALRQWGKEYHALLKKYLEGLDKVDFNAAVVIPWSMSVEERLGKPVVPATLAESYLQAAMHSTYHRAQINARLRELGGDPQTVDFILWVWAGKPSA